MIEQHRNKITYIHQKRKLLRNLDILKTCATEDLVQIDLSQNLIDNIQSLHLFRLPNLQILYLSINLLTNIEPLSRCHFPSLQKFYLFGNSIQDITPLIDCGLKKLKELRLGFSNRGNQIQDVSVIGKATWKDLEELSLDSNNINSLESLVNMPFTHLTHLYISNNHLCTFDANILNLTPRLKVLSMKGNYLTGVKFLTRCHLPELEYLNLSENKIVDIISLSSTKLNRLQKLSMAENEFVEVNVFLKCEWREVAKIIYCILSSSKPIPPLFIGKKSTSRSTRNIWRCIAKKADHRYKSCNLAIKSIIAMTLKSEELSQKSFLK